MKPLFIAAADLHFDEHGPWRYRGITGDAAHGLAQVVDYCLAHDSEGLWLLGDLMNRPTPRTQAVREFCDQMDRCREARVPVHYVLGDHDGRQDWPGLHPWPERADGAEVRVGPFLAMGLSYLPAGSLQAALSTIPEYVQLLFTHQKWAEFVGHSAQGKLSDVPRHVRYVVTGDYHVQVEGDLEDGRRVWSPGSIVATSVADAGPRAFLVGRRAGDDLECDFLQLRSRPIHRVHVGSADEAAYLAGPGIEAILVDAESSGLPVQVRRPIVDVEYYTDVPGVYTLLQPLQQRCFLFLRPRDRARTRRRAEVQAMGPVMSPEEAVAALATPGSPGHDWTLRLLRTKDRAAEWAALAAEVSHARQD